MGILGGKNGQKNRKTTLSPLVRRVLRVNKRTLFFFWGLVIWMLHIGRARHSFEEEMDRAVRSRERRFLCVQIQLNHVSKLCPHAVF